ncbi:MAG: glycerol-3-phosphate ABC transporter ATP-binding protein, partial [Rhodobacteraceae bacterium]|nr:glycerol-3-phosphate ABC transporter ATP-binding protein [Paracoccaceae bacterium]
RAGLGLGAEAGLRVDPARAMLFDAEGRRLRRVVATAPADREAWA